MTMDPDQTANRMAQPVKRGRPSRAEIEQRDPPTPAANALVKMEITGIRCPRCGRGVIPRVLRTVPQRRHLGCPLCGRTFYGNYDNTDRLISLQF